MKRMGIVRSGIGRTFASGFICVAYAFRGIFNVRTDRQLSESVRDCERLATHTFTYKHNVNGGLRTMRKRITDKRKINKYVRAQYL